MGHTWADHQTTQEEPTVLIKAPPAFSSICKEDRDESMTFFYITLKKGPIKIVLPDTRLLVHAL